MLLYAKRLGPQSASWRKGGFTLIEVLLFLLVVLALVTILLSSAGSLTKTRSANLESIAAKIASCEIEGLRKLAFASLPGSGSVGAPCDADLSKLPAGSATRTVAGYGSPPDPDIKQITISVTWTEKGIAKNVKMDTLIYKYGL